MDGDFSATRFLVEDPVVGLEGVLIAGSGSGIIGGSCDNSLDGTADGGMEESGLSRIQWLKSLSVLCTQLRIVKTAFCISPGEEGCGAGAVEATVLWNSAANFEAPREGCASGWRDEVSVSATVSDGLKGMGVEE